MCVVHPAMHQVTTRDRNRAIVLDRCVLPLDGPSLLGQVHRVHVVGVRTVDVHRGTDDQWLALVPTQRTGRERPHLSKALDVRRGDLRKRAIARRRVVLAGQDPLIVVRLTFHELLVGRDRQRCPERENRDRTETPLHSLLLLVQSLVHPSSSRRGAMGRKNRLEAVSGRLRMWQATPRDGPCQQSQRSAGLKPGGAEAPPYVPSVARRYVGRTFSSGFREPLQNPLSCAIPRSLLDFCDSVVSSCFAAR